MRDNTHGQAGGGEERSAGAAAMLWRRQETKLKGRDSGGGTLNLREGGRKGGKEGVREGGW